jgi:2,4-dienoyl-CoA reductase-like NADH-dependent reductase (Old Yellow Enzyme family)
MNLFPACALWTVGDESERQYPVLIKMNSEDLLPGGLRVDEMLQAAAMFEMSGVDSIELSGGTTWAALVLGDFESSFIKTTKTEAYWRDAPTRLRKIVHVPLMLVGGIRSYQVAEQLVDQDLTDYVSLSRSLIREPGLVNRWKSGDTRRADCVSDNACLGPAMAGKGIQCANVKT